MGRKRRLLAALAGAFWTATGFSHVVATSAGRQSDRIEWTERRNLFLLCASLATNALAFSVAYGYLRSALRRP
ncbi:hypothetical protein [Halopiger goleimassiliensis]|uniref:hypothetical protein n=1 Tax=Halopiger goleimassiliensis TaxID=1293048 RepID=UPI000677C913|nr:hypothetical protein [Halopiger goleimassiliensis]